MRIDLKDKVIVITGACGGIGLPMAKTFAENGSKVAVCDLKNAENVAEDIYKSGYTAKGYNFDITDLESVKQAMKQIAEDFGPIHVLINNAGINVGPDERKHVDEFNDKWWNAIINVDLTGTYYCTKNAIPYMTEGGSIINISSIVGMVGLRNQCAFDAAKAGVINFTRAIALELAPQGIRANVICPGSIGIDLTNQLWSQNTAMQGLLSHIPMGRQCKPEEVVNVCAFLASDLSSYMTGTVIPVDGGWTCGGFARDF